MCEHDAIVRLRDRVLTPKASSESLALGWSKTAAKMNVAYDRFTLRPPQGRVAVAA